MASTTSPRRPTIPSRPTKVVQGASCHGSVDVINGEVAGLAREVSDYRSDCLLDRDLASGAQVRRGHCSGPSFGAGANQILVIWVAEARTLFDEHSSCALARQEAGDPEEYAGPIAEVPPRLGDAHIA
jgi:hypothetical protein